MSNTLDTVFGDNPWADYVTNQRTVYVPELMEAYHRTSLYYKLITYGVNLAAQRTGSMVFTKPIDPEPNIETLGNHDLWMPQLFMDSQSVTISAERHGGKIQIHRYDDLITYWAESGAAGLRAIMRKRLAPNMVETLDILARNAHIAHFSPIFEGGHSDFSEIGASDTFDPGVARDVWLWADYTPDPVSNSIVGLVSPSAVYSFKSGGASTEWMGRLDYADPARLLNYEIGQYEGVRFVPHMTNVLWNCGEVIAQTTITAAADQGDGAPDPASAKVDGVYATGQTSGVTNYIQLASVSGFTVGDIVTLHKTRPSSTTKTAVAGGVQFDHYQNVQRRIVSIDTGNKRITLDKPLLNDWYNSVVSGQTYYGWVTLARPIMIAVFLKGPRGVVSGVLQPPQTYTPPPIDDTQAVYRFSWDAYLKYQIMNPEQFDLYIYSGPIRRLGETVSL